MNKIKQFIKESRQELKKVVWPTRDEVMISTRVVVLSVLVFACGLGLVDFILLKLIYLLF